MSHARQNLTIQDFLTHFEDVEYPRQEAKVTWPLDEGSASGSVRGDIRR